MRAARIHEGVTTLHTNELIRRSVLGLWLVIAAGCETKFNMAQPQAQNGLAGGTGAPAGAGSGAAPLPTAGTIASASGAGGTVGAGNAGGGTGGSTDTQVGSAGSGTAGTSSAGQAGTSGAGGTAGEGAMEAPQTCPATSMLTPGEATQTIQVGGMTRSFILHVPASYTGQTPVPLVLDFHGILMSSSLQRSFSGFAQLSESEGFIVAFPEGTDTAFNLGICCTSSTAIDDVAFARAIVTQLSQQGCIDRKRVHSAGYSMGGGMSMKLACEAADVFASIAYSAFDLMPEEDLPCHPSRPIAALAFRSTGDPIVPYPGAVDTIPPNGNPNLVTFIGAEANLTKWGMIDGCTGTPEAAGNGCQYYRQCSAGVEVGLCTKQGGGHDYMDAAAGWAFMKQHPLP